MLLVNYIATAVISTSLAEHAKEVCSCGHYRHSAGQSAIPFIKILPVEIIKTNGCHFQTNVGNIL